MNPPAAVTEHLPRGVFERPPGSKTYWIRYTDAGGKIRREKVGPRKQSAIELYQTRKTQVREARLFPERFRQRVIPFEELSKDFMEYSKSRHSPNSYRSNRQRMEVILATFRDKPAAQIMAQDIIRFLDNPAWKPATRNRYRALLSVVYSHAARNDKIDVNPAKKVRLFRENNARVRFLDPKEETRIRSAIASHEPEHEPEFDLALYTGMRRGEQWALRWTNIDFKRRILTVSNSKNGEARHLPLNVDAVKALKLLRAQGEGVFVVPGPQERTGRMAEDTRRWFDRVLRKAGVKNFHWHDLRHTFASRLVMAGVDISTVQALMGHKTISMTVRYSHLSAPHKRKAVDELKRTA